MAQSQRQKAIMREIRRQIKNNKKVVTRLKKSKIKRKFVVRTQDRGKFLQRKLQQAESGNAVFQKDLTLTAERSEGK